MLRTIVCPVCMKQPVFVLGVSAFCGNEDCNGFMWDMTKSEDDLLMDVTFIPVPKEKE